MAEIKPILEINPDHDIFSKINEKKDFTKLAEITPLLLDLAKLNEGMKIDDAYAFSKKVNDLLIKSL
jgi:molecular chaperone HtpG